MPSSRERRKRQGKVADHVKSILKILGYDLRNKHLSKTPSRVARIYMQELDLATLRKQPLKKLLSTTPSKYKSMIILRNHKTQTRCPHHLERVNLVISIGYIPNGKLLGLSKLARIANYYSEGLMLQEEIAEMIAEGIQGAVKPKGVGVAITAEHGCIQCRGVKSKDSDVVTSEMRGIFLDDPSTKQEFLDYIRRQQC